MHLAAAALSPIPGWPEDMTHDAQGHLIHFDLPAQPLAVALDAYAAASGRSVLFPDTLVAGRVSAPIHGSYGGREALDLMLAGTGLIADDVGTPGVDAFVLKPSGASGPEPPPPAAASAHAIDRYGGLVQARLLRVLCDDMLTAPGDYRALLRLAVDDRGKADVRLLGSTGDGRRDAAILRALGRTRFIAPPADVPQPLTLLILPRTEIAGTDCPPRAP